MTAFQVMPGLTPDEYADLRADIAAHGIRVPVDVDENGQVLDGHHRSLIAAELGIDCPRRVLRGLTDAEKVAHALAVNVHRRNLTTAQKRDLIAKSLRSAPEVSDREHARRTGTDHKTTADVRSGMEGRGEIPHVPTRIDAVGRQQPSVKPSFPPPIHSPRAEAPHVPAPAVASEAAGGNAPAPPAETAPGHPDEPDPIATAVAQVRSGPVYVAGKAIRDLVYVRQIIEKAGSVPEIIADFEDTELDRGIAADWMRELDRVLPILTDLRSRLARRNLRRVQ